MGPEEQAAIREWLGRLFAWATVGYVLTITTIIVKWNSRLGNILGEQGSLGNLRGESDDFDGFCISWGMLAYAAMIYGFVFFYRYFRGNHNFRERLISLIVAAFFAGSLALFLHMGVRPFIGD